MVTSHHSQFLGGGLEPSRLPDIMQSAVRMARTWGFPDERLEDIRTAVEEACLNALEHAPAGAEPRPTVEMTLEGPLFTVIVMSPGEPFAVPTAKPDLARKLDGSEPSRGWGLFLIRSLADDVSLTSHEGINLLRIVFSKHATSEEPERG